VTDPLQIRLVATDLDGTVVGPHGTISGRTVAALRAVEAAGAYLVLVTGRPPRWLPEVADQLGHTGIAICANGALVYDLRTDQVVRTHPLPTDTALEVVTRIRTALRQPTFAVETVDGFVHDPAYRPRWDAGLGDRARAIEDVLAGGVPALKLLVRDESSDGDSMLAAVGPALDGLAAPTHSNERDCLVEVSALGVDKGATLAQVAADLGVEAGAAVAFGDMPNDVPMLRWAGLSYAVADGHAAALAATTHRAAVVAEDGVAQVIESLLADGRIGAWTTTG
jgi:Cof subfamily protein (haloacid dehalogenase superfamily)